MGKKLRMMKNVRFLIMLHLLSTNVLPSRSTAPFSFHHSSLQNQPHCPPLFFPLTSCVITIPRKKSYPFNVIFFFSIFDPFLFDTLIDSVQIQIHSYKCEIHSYKREIQN
ncbi:hypothetical protein MtrunA17_Chr8g0371211 [Medicago truncatula]|uniref:Transmembrane protein n=1 Tax=Medicago truncatula TaxID=3880 RepID=A0A396GLA9_MEDTR|nr:hypothetical protein MtrunA17_Chr8g0371211 [Medicago truncatula]